MHIFDQDIPLPILSVNETMGGLTGSKIVQIFQHKAENQKEPRKKDERLAENGVCAQGKKTSEEFCIDVLESLSRQEVSILSDITFKQAEQPRDLE